MYIETLHVENVGPFKKLDARFNPKMNVIVGVNGVGKTSLLRCIAYSLTNNRLDSMRMRKDATIKLNCIQGTDKYTYGAEHFVNKDQDYRTINISGWRLSSSEGYKNVMMFADKDYNLLAIGAYRYFSYKRMEGMTREALRLERRRKYLAANPSYLETMEMPDIKQWMVNRYFQIDKPWAETERSNWNAIMSKLQVIAPRESQFKFVKIERDLEPVFFLNGSECYLEELSSGFKSILSIVFMIVDWIEGINEGDSAKIENAIGTVLIDEIDAHLHPSWQATILQSLRVLFPNIQFVVTTHSPNVIMSAEKDEVMLFNNYNGTVNLAPDARSFGAWQVSSVLSDVMQAPGMDYISIASAVNDINRAYEEKNIEKFNSVLEYLESVLNPNDSILKIYHIRQGELTLRND